MRCAIVKGNNKYEIDKSEKFYGTLRLLLPCEDVVKIESTDVGYEQFTKEMPIDFVIAFSRGVGYFDYYRRQGGEFDKSNTCYIAIGGSPKETHQKISEDVYISVYGSYLVNNPHDTTVYKELKDDGLKAHWTITSEMITTIQSIMLKHVDDKETLINIWRSRGIY